MKKLLSELQQNKKVKNFRIYLKKHKQVSLGMLGKFIGGAYTPIEYADQVGGELQIEWKNGEVSFTNITNITLENPKLAIENAEKISIKDEFSKEFLEAYKLTKPSKQYSPETEKIITENQDTLVTTLRNILSFEKKLGRKKHEIDMSVTKSDVNVVNSKGLELKDTLTSLNISSEWDMKLSYSINSRFPVSIEKYKRNIKFLAKLLSATETPVRPAKLKNPVVILYPDFSWSLIAFFIFSNLSGSLVANRQSLFKIEDFRKSKKFFADWLNLKVNPKQDLTPGGENFTPEGVEAGEIDFIRNGKLKTPILDLKHAKKLNMSPTVGIDSPYTTSYFNNIKTENLESFILKQKEAVIIPYCLGLRTQNQLTGDYSLPSPYSIYIKDGKLVGSFKSIISGNIFEELKNEVEFVRDELFPLPSLVYKPNILIE